MKFDDISDQLNAILQEGCQRQYQQKLEALVSFMPARWGLCESPIEQRLLAAMMFMELPLFFDGENDLPAIFGQDIQGDGHPPFADEWVSIIPQKSIGEYRVDFLIRAKFFKRTPRDILIVECDGHDFHEKNKEQAARDKSRDRFFVTQGLSVLRFTGSEIYRDPFRCAEEISRTLFTIEGDSRPEDYR